MAIGVFARLRAVHVSTVLALLIVSGCAGAPPPSSASIAPGEARHDPTSTASASHQEGGHDEHARSGSAHEATPAGARIDQQLAEVARIHGGAGPWAVAGYRMGRYALERLGLTHQSFDLEVIHHSPRSVQFTCIADGAAAATGASLGKLNLSLVEEADEAAVATTYRRRSTGASITLRPTATFKARFKDVPREQLPAAGRVAMELPETEIFEEQR
ncbi:FmdE family protein [Chondromyces crocatus]|uniref:Formylmethanofuran dehydrogenase subunit E domain-containing protein n=1 Tax=Chondromyces crocatus TaxID=52 RepID=A0A0K1END3_CHOCO|nr:FmdE family protein [Chondromyces crocatus]AKT42093.1 uncharacterized protein CMC5_063160 [Chondromyces crocatus]